MVGELTAKETGVIAGAGEVSVVAHRVVHGGEKFTEGTLITDEVLAQIEALNPLAPLHNPVNVAGIREMRRLFPAVPHVAVFDTAFHHTLPAYAYLYGLPYELYEKKGVRRYGFHGTSHHYVALRAAQFLERRPNELRLVSCHLGNGSSLCAVDHGRSVDTTMGFTPAEGLIMGTRCGDVDAGVLAFLERTERHDRLAERGDAEQEKRLARPVRHFERHARNPQGRRRGQSPRVARAQGLLLSRAEIHRRLCGGHGRIGRGDLHGRHRPGQRGSPRAGLAGIGVHGHHARRAAQSRRARVSTRSAASRPTTRK